MRAGHLWVWACGERMGSVREMERWCRHHPALGWLCGLETISRKVFSLFSDIPPGSGDAARLVAVGALPLALFLLTNADPGGSGP